MNKIYNFNDQFKLQRQYYYQQLDFLCWFRYFYVIRAIIDLHLKHVLEAGPGAGIIKGCIQPIVEKYVTLDINNNLNPDIFADVKKYQIDLESQFDCVIATDIVEHLPFTDLSTVCANFAKYLKPDGKALITIPHRRSNFLFMSPTQIPHVFTVPTGFLSPGAFYRRFIKRKIWIDPDHEWEIGDGHIKKKDVEQVFKNSGFSIYHFQKLLYVDFWILSK